MQNADTAASKQHDRIIIGASAAFALGGWMIEWRPLAVFLGIVAFFYFLLSVYVHQRAEQEDEQRQGEIIKSRWHVIEAAEAVIQASDRFCIGMPTELEDAIERLREALAKEGRRAA
jgi:hypothetical protein